MPTVREFLASLGGSPVQACVDMLNQSVVSTAFPKADLQDRAVFLTIQTPDGLLYLRLEERSQREWLRGLSSNLRYGGSRNEYTSMTGDCPLRKLELVWEADVVGEVAG